MFCVGVAVLRGSVHKDLLHAVQVLKEVLELGGADDASPGDGLQGLGGVLFLLFLLLFSQGVRKQRNGH